MPSSYFPIFIDLKDKKVIVFGGGKIALRRINTLLTVNALVTVISPSLLPQIKDLYIQNKINFIEKKYIYGDCKDCFFVLAITSDSDVNYRIYEECKEKNILVNIANDKTKCDFYFPAFIKENNVCVGVCSDGNNHSLVRKVSDNIKLLKDKIFYY